MPEAPVRNLTRLAVGNYRSLLNLVLPLGRLNVITGPNGSGKSNLYRALRLLAETSQGSVVRALAREGGLGSTLWAGPEKISRQMRNGQVPIQGGPRKKRIRLRMGFADEQFGYSISLGLPSPSDSAFSRDPEVKQEAIWMGSRYRPAALLIDRKGVAVRARTEIGWNSLHDAMNPFDSMFTQVADPRQAPEVLMLRETIRSWRFYDQLRTDREAPARLPQVGTRTAALSHDGHDLAAALQTIREIGDAAALDRAIQDAFPGGQLGISSQADGHFLVQFHQHGLLRPLTAAELSDGTLRYLLLIAALFTPCPPALMVLNEPETSLNPDLLPALARQIIHASQGSQIWIVTHSESLAKLLSEAPECHLIRLEKTCGQTENAGQSLLDVPPWQWPDNV
jgi:predicted ATPase